MRRRDTRRIDALSEAIRTLGEHGQAQQILYRYALIDHALERRLRAKMPRLSNKRAKELFRGAGPFSSSSVKIDVLHAMGDISDRIRLDLHVLREIRNAFAHPEEEYTHIDTHKGLELLRRFSDYDAELGGIFFLFRKADQCLAELRFAEEVEHLPG
jgi:DNA-binding MltR family transcriptional regulator